MDDPVREREALPPEGLVFPFKTDMGISAASFAMPVRVLLPLEDGGLTIVKAPCSRTSQTILDKVPLCKACGVGKDSKARLSEPCDLNGRGLIIASGIVSRDARLERESKRTSLPVGTFCATPAPAALGKEDTFELGV